MPSFWRPHDVFFFFLKERHPKNHLANIIPDRIVKTKQKTKSDKDRTRKRTRMQLSWPLILCHYIVIPKSHYFKVNLAFCLFV